MFFVMEIMFDLETFLIASNSKLPTVIKVILLLYTAPLKKNFFVASRINLLSRERVKKDKERERERGRVRENEKERKSKKEKERKSKKEKEKDIVKERKIENGRI